MAARGSVAKEYVINKIAEVFGADYAGTHDGKYYVWAKENGERLQIAIALTCPKTPVAFGDAPVSNVIDFRSEAPAVQPSTVIDAPAAEITEEEKKNVADLLARLGL